jgi:hypothetical protein
MVYISALSRRSFEEKMSAFLRILGAVALFSLYGCQPSAETAAIDDNAARIPPDASSSQLASGIDSKGFNTSVNPA